MTKLVRGSRVLLAVLAVSAAPRIAGAQAAVGYGMAAASSATSTAASAPRMSGANGSVHRKVNDRTAVVHTAQPARVRAVGSRRATTARAMPPQGAVVGAAARPVGGGITVVGSEKREVQPE